MAHSLDAECSPKPYQPRSQLCWSSLVFMAVGDKKAKLPELSSQSGTPRFSEWHDKTDTILCVKSFSAILKKRDPSHSQPAQNFFKTLNKSNKRDDSLA